MNPLLLLLAIALAVGVFAAWNMPDALRTLAGKLLEREAYILAGREAKAAQARSWAIGQEWLKYRSGHRADVRREGFSVR